MMAPAEEVLRVNRLPLTWENSDGRYFDRSSRRWRVLPVQLILSRRSDRHRRCDLASIQFRPRGATAASSVAPTFPTFPVSTDNLGLLEPAMAYVYQSWRQIYQQALGETDPDKLLEHVYAAEEAICERWKELATSPDDHELRAINLAVQGLLKIKLEKLKWPAIELPKSDRTERLLPRVDGLRVNR